MKRIVTAVLAGVCGVGMLGTADVAFGQVYVNGYTYVAPSYYLAPPVVTYTSPFPPVMFAPAPVYVAPRPVLVAPPPVVYPTLAPVVAPAPVVATYAYPAPVPLYRERLKTSRREIEYTAKGYNPYTGRKEKVEVEWDRRGVEYKVKD